MTGSDDGSDDNRAWRPLGGDPGVQLERTALARQRTILASTTICLVLAMLAVREQLWLLAAAATVLAAIAVSVPLSLREPETGDLHLHRWPALVAKAGLVMALGLLGATTAWMALHP